MPKYQWNIVLTRTGNKVCRSQAKGATNADNKTALKLALKSKMEKYKGQGKVELRIEEPAATSAPAKKKKIKLVTAAVRAAQRSKRRGVSESDKGADVGKHEPNPNLAAVTKEPAPAEMRYWK